MQKGGLSLAEMNRVTISVPDRTDLNFRKKAAIKFAFKRGWYGRAVIEAMKLWITVQNATEESIPDEKKEVLWETFKDHINIQTDDPEEILDSIAEYFTSEFKIAEEIEYDLKDDEIIVNKKGSFESLFPFLMTKKGDCIVFNCPVKIIMDIALQDLTGKKYKITESEENTIITPEAIKQSDDGY